MTTALRASGPYALYRGVWWPSTAPPAWRPAVLTETTDGEPTAGFEPTSNPRVFAAEVPLSDLDDLQDVTVTCTFRRGGPFRVLRLRDDGRALLEYRGSDRGWAEGLPGFAAGDYHRTSGEITGLVDVADISGVSETSTPLPRS